MKIRFSNLQRPKRTAKRLAQLVNGLPLAKAQAWTATLYGYKDWHSLASETERLRGLPSPDDEDVDRSTRDSRWKVQSQLLSEVSGFPLDQASHLLQAVGPTARGGPKAQHEGDPAPESLLFPRALHPSIAAHMEELFLELSKDPRISRLQAKRTADTQRAVVPTPYAEPFFNALKSGDEAAALAMLQQRPDFSSAVSETGSTPLIDCVLGGSKRLLDALLQAKANPNLADTEGFTPLHEAARRGLPWAVKMLLDADAKPNWLTNSGWSPLMMTLTSRYSPATPKDYAEVIELLLDAGADVTQANFAGISAKSLVDQIPDIDEMTRTKVHQASRRTRTA